MASLVLIIGFAIFVIATFTYAKWVEKRWGVDGDRPTPAHTLRDDMDYVPAPKAVLFGHHFSSIAGAAPVVGAIGASAFGWLPVAIWCVVACVFIGGVQDFGALFASVRHEGRSIGEVIKDNIDLKGKRIFCVSAWFTTILLSAAFYDIVADTFVSTPAAGTASLLFIMWAVIYGLAVNRLGVPSGIASVIGVILVFASVWIGIEFPLVLSHTTWIIVLLIYTAIAMVSPVWLLLQPRDFLSSFLLYAMMIGCFAGIIAYQPSIEMPAFTGFMANGTPLFPILFVTLACGAISGFHSLVGSGTTSKQVSNEKDIRLIGYGGMLLEGTLALIALVTVMFLTSDIRDEVTANGALYVFSYGLGTFLSKLGIPFAIGQTFAGMALSAFAMTTLDTAMRLARYISQEFIAGDRPVNEVIKEKKNIAINPFFCSGISLVAAAILAFNGYEAIWPIFGSANQMLSVMAFLGIVFWLRSTGKGYRMCIIPMIWMGLVAIAALGWNLFINIGTSWILVVLAAILLITVFCLIALAVKKIKDEPVQLN